MAIEALEHYIDHMKELNCNQAATKQQSMLIKRCFYGSSWSIISMNPSRAGVTVAQESHKLRDGVQFPGSPLPPRLKQKVIPIYARGR